MSVASSSTTSHGVRRAIRLFYRRGVRSCWFVGSGASNVSATRSLYQAARTLYQAARTLYQAARPLSSAMRPLYSATRPLYCATRPLSSVTRPFSSASRPLSSQPHPHSGGSTFVEPTEGLDTLHVVDQLCNGPGYYLAPNMFSRAEVAEAKRVVEREMSAGVPRVTHFHGGEDPEAVSLQARTWDLLNKGEVYERMVQHPLILEVAVDILGDDCQLGSVAANTLHPGARGQEPHLDYPYWDYYARVHWPHPPKGGQHHPYYMNFMATVMLDDFTVENGATALVPYSQLEPEWPDPRQFKEKSIRCTGRAGDVLLFVGLMQHASMPNLSDASRTAVLIQYLPKYIRPMEDQKRLLTREVASRATPALRSLLLLDYPYPAVLDQQGAGNAEGARSDFVWK